MKKKRKAKMDKDFPCTKCMHLAKKHFVSVDGSEKVCVGCVEGGWIEADEHLHEFVGDNLKYMELLNKRKELLSE